MKGEIEDDAPPKQRFFVRAVSCVIVPPALAAYYLWTYTYFLIPSSGKAHKHSNLSIDARYIWWSWFIIGALGLNVSTYVLAGVEAGLLTSKRFNTLPTEQIQMHKDKSWSKITGWWATGRMLATKKGNTRVLSPAWVPLFALSVLSWVSALSGLTMQTQQTYRAGSNPGAALVGLNITHINMHFNMRTAFDVLDSAYQAWRHNQPPKIPALGVLYSMPGANIGFNMTTGNDLPSSTEDPIFLAPQADVPVIGTAWGISLRYSCRPVHKISDFKILSKRLNSTIHGYLDGTAREPGNAGSSLSEKPPDHYIYDVPGLPNATISVLSPMTRTSSAITVAEVGLGSGMYNLMSPSMRSYGSPYNPGGLDTEELLEFALWQAQPSTYISFEEGGALSIRPAIHPPVDTIPELDGEYLINDINLEEYPSREYKYLMTAIGVQCTSASSAGWAEVNGLTGTFRNFRGDNPWVPYNRTNLDMKPMFEFAKAGNLQRALESTYKHVAIALMYTEPRGANMSWETGNLTGAVPWTTLGPPDEGGALPLLVAILMSLWALGCIALGLAYSFRARWGAFFTTRSLYWYCKSAGIEPMEVVKKTF
ncbi:hypothetical protein P885DRAFT_62666 [Corynascus similis CBS 632.67]